MIPRVLVIYRELSRVEPYATALREAGANAEILPASGTVALDGYAGLVLTGGTDVNPQLYGEAIQPECDTPDITRDEIECALIRQALERDLPILAICRGLQILNVQHGGSLIQHIEPPDRHRRVTPDRGQPAHAVTIEPGTLLEKIAGASRWSVNSRHHQAVKTVGDHLRVSARDPEDGTVEALERPDKRFVLGVQWHPEDQAPGNPEQRKIFQSFTAAVRYNSNSK